jgi:UDP-glucuronate decarboxylase
VRILVAGGAGFIGSHLCKSLIDDGHDVVSVDNFITGRKSNLKQIADNHLFTSIHADITEHLDPPGTFDRVYHLASPASPVGYMRNSIETHLTNSIGTLNLIRLAKSQNARFLFASTSEAYGDPLVHPQTEDYFGNVNPVGPRSCYDESKRFGESLTMEFVRNFGLDGRIIRIFNTYGPHSDPDDGRVIPAFIMHALRNEPLTIFGDGQQTRSLCYVTDLVQGIRLAMETEDTTGEVINLGNPDERTVLEIAETIIRICGSNSSINFLAARPDDPYRRCPDISKAKSLLSWEPSIEIQEGLQATIEYLSGYVQDDLGSALRS